MDPQALWHELVTSIQREILREELVETLESESVSSDRAYTVELLRNLADWIEKGGFLPRP